MSNTQAALGWRGPEQNIDIIVTNRTTGALAVGDVVMLDWRRSDADSTSNTLGLTTAGLANVVTPAAGTSAQFSAGIFGVCQQAAADNAKLRVRLAGTVDACRLGAALVLATGVCVVGASLALEVKTTFDTTAAAGSFPKKVVFQGLTAIGGAGTTDGWFDGVHGFGAILTT